MSSSALAGPSKFVGKRAPWIRVLAVCYLLAPLGNIFAAMFEEGERDWNRLDVFLIWLSYPTGIVWAAFALTFLGGIALFFQRKLSWFLAIVALLICGSIDAASFRAGASGGWLKGFSLGYLSLLADLSVLSVLFVFRYPYLDRRERIFGGVAPRYACDLPVRIGKFKGAAVNLSRSGALFELDRHSYGIGATLVCELGTVKGLRCQVARVTAGGFAVQFKAGLRQRRALNRLIKELAASPGSKAAARR